MLRVGLTGGIGSGKTTVGRLLAERGAVVVDADAAAREVVAPGTPGLAAVVDAFGSEVLLPDGSLDRPGLAAIVFADVAARQRLEEIVHPLVGARVAELVAAADPTAVVVYDVPLLVENALEGQYDVVVVVEAPLEVRLQRLSDRGLSADEALARIRAQATDEQRRAAADVVIDNGGTPEQLAERVADVWARLSRSD